MFWILHIVAVLFGLWGLIITIPLHLIYLSVKKPSGLTALIEYTSCPKCGEQVKRVAVLCKHCGSDIKPNVKPSDFEQKDINNYFDKHISDVVDIRINDNNCNECGRDTIMENGECSYCNGHTVFHRTST